jgi:hypothetical protein
MCAKCWNGMDAFSGHLPSAGQFTVYTQYMHIHTSCIVWLVQSGVEGTDARNPFCCVIYKLCICEASDTLR